MKNPHLAKRNKCTACFACMNACPLNAISFQEAFDGHIYPFINKNCIKCGKCSKACPIVNKYNYHSSTKSILFAAWAENIELRNKSASGGIFAALALYIIQKGGYVSGAVLEANAVVHILTNNVGDISRMQGSKYQQGTLSGIFRRINKLLREKKRVLFSGTGCQIAALYNFLGDEFREYLITVDIICGGFPSRLPMSLFLSQLQQPVKIVSFRDKANGWKSLGYRYSLKIEEHDGIIRDFGDNNLPIKAFSTGLTNRKSCFNCTTACIHRRSSVTIGDFWGDQEFSELHKDGLSIIIVHDTNMIEVLDEAKIRFEKVKWRSVLYFNPRLMLGTNRFIRFHPFRAIYPYILRWLPISVASNLFLNQRLPSWYLFCFLNRLLDIDKTRRINKILKQIESE